LQPGSTLRRCPDITKLRSLGFEPQTPLALGARKTVEWYRNHPRTRAPQAEGQHG
jgi:UDP-glucose 4-epimerase